MDKFARMRERFPVTGNRVYLNNAAVGPMPPFVSEECRRIHEGYAGHGGELEGQWHERIGRIRERVAELVRCSSEEVFFTRNTSEGLILAARAFPWNEGDNVVSLSGEFPAVTVPFHLLERRGVKMRLVQPGSDNRYRLRDIEDAVDNRTRMLVASFVEFSTGCRNDLGALGELCRSRGLFFAVDGVQGVGALATDFEGWGLDLLSVGSHKWMLAGEGGGFCCVRHSKLDMLEPLSASWLSLDDPLEFLSRGARDPSFDKPLQHSARRFEGGTVNVAGIMALGRSVETMLELGVDDIERRVTGLAWRAAEGLIARGYDVTSPREPESRSAIVSFRPRSGEPRELLKSLRARKISLGFPCGYLRLSPHYYNNGKDIDFLLDSLPRSR